MLTQKSWKMLLLACLGLTILWYIANNPEAFSQLKKITLKDALLLVFLRGFFLLINGLILKDFAARFFVKLLPLEWTGLSFVTALGNYITPFSGGMLFRAGYLKRKHGLPLTQFAVLLAANYLVTFFSVAIIGLTVSLMIMRNTPGFSWWLTILFSCIAAGVLTVLILPLPNIKSNHWLIQKLEEAVTGWKLIKNDRLFILRLTGYTFLNIMSNGFSFWLAYRSIGVNILFSHALIISLIAVFSLLINITPANLGVQETVVLMASHLLGQGSSEGLAVALIIRAATMIPLLCFGPFFVHILTTDTKKEDSSTIDNDIKSLSKK